MLRKFGFTRIGIDWGGNGGMELLLGRLCPDVVERTRQRFIHDLVRLERPAEYRARNTRDLPTL